MATISNYLGRTRWIPKHAFLTTTGEGGTVNLVGDYSSATTDAYHTVTGNKYDIYSVTIAITDETKLIYNGYGGIASGAIINGIKFYVNTLVAGETPLLGGFPIIRNYEWYSLTDEVATSSWDQTPQTIAVLIDLDKKFGGPLELLAGDKFIVRLNDNFTGLVSQTVALGGRLYF